MAATNRSSLGVKAAKEREKLRARLANQLQRDLLKLLQTGVHADVKFETRDDDILAHSAILQSRAPRFYQAAAAEKTDTKFGETGITISNRDAESTQQILRNIYTDDYFADSASIWDETCRPIKEMDAGFPLNDLSNNTNKREPRCRDVKQNIELEDNEVEQQPNENFDIQSELRHPPEGMSHAGSMDMVSDDGVISSCVDREMKLNSNSELSLSPAKETEAIKMNENEKLEREIKTEEVPMDTMEDSPEEQAKEDTPTEKVECEEKVVARRQLPRLPSSNEYLNTADGGEGMASRPLSIADIDVVVEQQQQQLQASYRKAERGLGGFVGLSSAAVTNGGGGGSSESSDSLEAAGIDTGKVVAGTFEEEEGLPLMRFKSTDTFFVDEDYSRHSDFDRPTIGGLDSEENTDDDNEEELPADPYTASMSHSDSQEMANKTPTGSTGNISLISSSSSSSLVVMDKSPTKEDTPVPKKSIPGGEVSFFVSLDASVQESEENKSVGEQEEGKGKLSKPVGGCEFFIELDGAAGQASPRQQAIRRSMRAKKSEDSAAKLGKKSSPAAVTEKLAVLTNISTTGKSPANNQLVSPRHATSNTSPASAAKLSPSPAKLRTSPSAAMAASTKSQVTTSALPSSDEQTSLSAEELKEWEACSKLGQDLLKLFVSRIGADVSIVVEGGKAIPAHKCILSVRSEYFAAMFSGSWKEAGTGTVNIKGISYKTMQTILYHMYGGTLHIPEGISVPELIFYCDMYGLHGLKDVASFLLKKRFCHFFHKPCSGCVSGVLEILPLAVQYKLSELTEKCFRWCVSNCVRVWPCKQFAMLHPSILNKCLQSALSYMQADKVLQTVCDCDQLFSTLPEGVSWCRAVHALASQLLQGCVGFLAAHYPDVVATDSFESLGQDQGWNLDIVEDVLMQANTAQTVNTACKTLVTLAKRVSTVALSPDNWHENFPMFLSRLHKRCENFLVENAADAIQCKEWKLLASDMQKKILLVANMKEDASKKVPAGHAVKNIDQKFARNSNAPPLVSKRSPTAASARVNSSTPKSKSAQQLRQSAGGVGGGGMSAGTRQKSNLSNQSQSRPASAKPIRASGRGRPPPTESHV